jgi:hypothetical protein
MPYTPASPRPYLGGGGQLGFSLREWVQRCGPSVLFGGLRTPNDTRYPVLANCMTVFVQHMGAGGVRPGNHRERGHHSPDWA